MPVQVLEPVFAIDSPEYHNLSFSLPDDEFEKCVKIIEPFIAATENSEYATDERGSSNYDSDHMAGKYCEYAVRWILINRWGLDVSDVDVAVREGGKKGWWVDLAITLRNGRVIRCHVKCCMDKTFGVMEKYHVPVDYSWTFNTGNRHSQGGMDPLVADPTCRDLLLLMYTPKGGVNSFNLILSTPWNLVSNLLREPISPWRKGIKSCLYFADIWNRFFRSDYEANCV